MRGGARPDLDGPARDEAALGSGSARSRAISILPITGLTTSAIVLVLDGRKAIATERLDHIATVPAVIRELAAAREAATGSAARAGSPDRWRQTATLATSQGPRTVLEVLADPRLAREALVEWQR